MDAFPTLTSQNSVEPENGTPDDEIPLCTIEISVPGLSPTILGPGSTLVDIYSLGRVFFSCHPCVSFANAIPTRINNQVKHIPFNTWCQYHHKTTLNWKHPMFLVKLEAEHYCRPRTNASSKLRDLPWLTNSWVTNFAHWSNSLVGCLSHSLVSWSVGSQTH